MTVNLARNDVPSLLQMAFGTSKEGVYAAEAFLNQIPEGGKYPRRLHAFGGNPVAASSVKQELIGIIEAKTSAPAPASM